MPLWAALVPAAALGSLVGMGLMYLSYDFGRDVSVYPYFILGAFGFSLAGLALLGLPLTLLARRLAIHRWSILLATVAGGVVGRIVSGVFGLDIGTDSLAGLFGGWGFLVGAPTGLFWSLLVRPRLVHMIQAQR
jgi:hypothetical protein